MARLVQLRYISEDSAHGVQGLSAEDTNTPCTRPDFAPQSLRLYSQQEFGALTGACIPSIRHWTLTPSSERAVGRDESILGVQGAPLGPSCFPQISDAIVKDHVRPCLHPLWFCPLPSGCLFCLDEHMGHAGMGWLWEDSLCSPQVSFTTEVGKHWRNSSLQAHGLFDLVGSLYMTLHLSHAFRHHH